MNYPPYRYPVVVAPKPTSSRKKWLICGAICLVLLFVILVMGLALGLGLGLGLRKDTETTTASSTLSVPSVSCTYVSPSICGCASTKPSFLSARIINGYSAVAHSWPWTVLLYYNNAQRCDGFLVSYQHVITAAHCVTGLSTSLLQVSAGVHSISSSPNKQIRSVSAMLVHPSFTASNYNNDIAILKLASNLTTTTDVGVCCLSSDTSLPTVNEHAVIVGWGSTSASSLTLPDTLQQAVVQIKSASSCGTSASSSTQFCAGYGTTDSCQGDSGGPLMTAVNNAWTCTGIVSYGKGCNGAGYYTRVSYYRSFIDNAIATL